MHVQCICIINKSYNSGDMSHKGSCHSFMGQKKSRVPNCLMAWMHMHYMWNAKERKEIRVNYMYYVQKSAIWLRSGIVVNLRYDSHNGFISE